MLRDLAGDVSQYKKTVSDSDFYEKYASLDVKKATAEIVIPRVNRLILMSKLEPEIQKITAVIFLKKNSHFNGTEISLYSLHKYLKCFFFLFDSIY